MRLTKHQQVRLLRKADQQCRLYWIAAASMIVGLTGCAGTTVTPISYGTGATAVGGKADADAKGLRYYEGAYFLIVYSNGKGGLKSEVKFLPDLTRKRSINPYAYLAKNETTLTFSNGMLTESNSVIDEAIIPKAMISAAEKIASAGFAAARKAGEEPVLPKPVLFKIRINPTTGDLELLGGTTDGMEIKVTLEGTDK
jgi:hypothetical protein